MSAMQDSNLKPRTWQKDEDPSYDLVLATQDREFHVHSTFLTAHSPVFRAMLSQEFAEKHDRRVEISDFTSAQIEAFLQQLYAECPLTLQNITLLFPVAHKYMAARLVNNCLKWLDQLPETCDGAAVLECVRVVSKRLSNEETPKWSDGFIKPAAERVIQLYRHAAFPSIYAPRGERPPFPDLSDINSSTICQMMYAVSK